MVRGLRPATAASRPTRGRGEPDRARLGGLSGGTLASWRVSPPPSGADITSPRHRAAGIEFVDRHQLLARLPRDARIFPPQPDRVDGGSTTSCGRVQKIRGTCKISFRGTDLNRFPRRPRAGESTLSAPPSAPGQRRRHGAWAAAACGRSRGRGGASGSIKYWAACCAAPRAFPSAATLRSSLLIPPLAPRSRRSARVGRRAAAEFAAAGLMEPFSSAGSSAGDARRASPARALR